MLATTKSELFTTRDAYLIKKIMEQHGCGWVGFVMRGTEEVIEFCSPKRGRGDSTQTIQATIHIKG